MMMFFVLLLILGSWVFFFLKVGSAQVLAKAGPVPYTAKPKP